MVGLITTLHTWTGRQSFFCVFFILEWNFLFYYSFIFLPSNFLNQIACYESAVNADVWIYDVQPVRGGEPSLLFSDSSSSSVV